MIKSKMEGEVAKVEDKRPKKPCGQEHDGSTEKDGRILEVKLS